MRNWATEYSALEGIAKRCVPHTMKECRVPKNGPSKPSERSFRMKSRRLQGVQRLTQRLPVQIDAADYRQRVTQLQAQENPFF